MRVQTGDARGCGSPRHFSLSVLAVVPSAAAASDVPQDGLLLHGPFARKPKRIRTAFSPSQLLRLERAFEKNHYVVGAERKQLAGSLSLSETQVTVPRQRGGGRGLGRPSPPAPAFPGALSGGSDSHPGGAPAEPVFGAPGLQRRLASQRPRDATEPRGRTGRWDQTLPRARPRGPQEVPGSQEAAGPPPLLGRTRGHWSHPSAVC